jgi:pectin methylesterase-like acyl-CoA thioesterase
VIVLATALSPGATTYHVCPDGSGDFTTIQAAIDAAVDGDVVELCDAVFSGDGNGNCFFRGKAITVRSASGVPEQCVVLGWAGMAAFIESCITNVLYGA